MAAFMKHHVLTKVAFSRKFSTKSWRPTPGRKICSTKDEISAKGFMRPVKGYLPPDNVKEKIDQICTRVVSSGRLDTKLKIDKPDIRYSIFSECFREFHYSIPNSLLHTILTLEDLYRFYMTPIDVTVPYDSMKNMELPPNLHIQSEPIRFHPDTDTMFGGETAFPKSSTIVTGIYTRKKYKSYIVDDAEP